MSKARVRVKENASSPRTKCKVTCCDKPTCSKKQVLCKGHYTRWKKGTDINTPLVVHNSKQGCKAKACAEKHHAGGYCRVHFSRFKRGVQLYGPVRKIDSGRGCLILNCDKKHYGTGLCLNHFNRVERLKKKKKFIQEKGGKCLDCGGVFKPECFDFDNVVEEAGHVSINTLLNRNASDVRILTELKRCELVCANCHRTRTRNRYGELIFSSENRGQEYA